MIPKEAIEKAIEGKWRKADVPHIEEQLGRLWVRFEREENERHLPIVWESDIALDPSFWHSLGKALGWGAQVYSKRYRAYWPRYMHEAMMFYDLIITAGDTKAFWKELLATK